MRIIVRGWGRDQGETEIMSVSLSEAETAPDQYSWGKTYLAVERPDNPYLTKVRISTSTEVRLGGNYLLHVVLSRSEIARLFFETHGGDVVRMFRTFMEEEENEKRTHALQWMAERDERRQQRTAEEKESK